MSTQVREQVVIISAQVVAVEQRDLLARLAQRLNAA